MELLHHQLNSYHPEGVQLENGKFRAAKISPILRLIKEQKDLKNNVVPIMACQGSEISKQFLKEIIKIEKLFSKLYYSDSSIFRT